MNRALTLAALLPLVLTVGCTAGSSAAALETPALRPASPSIRAPEYELPYHAASIVDLALLPPAKDERWRLASGDLDGWIRFWADEELLAARYAHPAGLAALALAPDGTLYTAGFEGRVLEWAPGALEPTRAFGIGRPITALAVSDNHLALSDGKFVQLWTRGETPQLEWSTQAHAFVTGLSLSAGGEVLAAAELRESAMRDAIATHPLAEFRGAGLSAVDPEQAADLRYLAARDFPGAAADYLEVWQPGHQPGHQPSFQRSSELIPAAPIDSDLGVLPPGGVVYREIYGTNNAGMVGRRLEDRAHVSLALVKPWAFFTSESQDPEQARLPNLPVGDFVLGPAGEIIVVDHFPGWDREPPAQGWRVGSQRELAIGHGYAALGDALGNLAVVELARPKEPGWLNPGSEQIGLLAAAPNTPWIATATLEPRTQYRLWSLGEGIHRALRVEEPRSVIDGESDEPIVSMFPIAMALDDELTTLATSLSSFDADHQAAVRLISPSDGATNTLTLASMPHVIEIGISPDASELLAWSAGYPAFRWSGPEWTPLPGSIPSGAPHLSADGRFSGHVSALQRAIVARERGETQVELETDPVVSELGAAIPAAIASDGTLAVVEPFGGGVLDLIALDGSSRSIELPGAATALAWVSPRPERASTDAPTEAEAGPEISAPADAEAEVELSSGAPILIVGFQDGSIVRIDRETDETRPIHAGAGGRVWALAALGGRPGVFVELDDRGLTLHRLDDDALVELELGDATTLARHADSPPQEPSSAGLVALWRPGTAMPVCAIFDGSEAGVLAPPAVRRLGPGEVAALFEAFAAGGACPGQPAPAAIEPLPPMTPPTD